MKCKDNEIIRYEVWDVSMRFKQSGTSPLKIKSNKFNVTQELERTLRIRKVMLTSAASTTF